MTPADSPRLPDSAIVARRDELVTVTVAGTVVVHDPFEDRYVRLSSSAALLWERLDPEARIDELAGRLVERYDIPSERAADDVRTLVGSLIDRGIVRVVADAASRS